MPRTAVSSPSAVEEKIDTRRSESEPVVRIDVGKRQMNMQVSKSEPIEEHRAHESVVNINPALANDLDVKIRHLLKDTVVEEGAGPASLQTNISHSSANLYHIPTDAQQGGYTNLAGTSASDSAQRARVRALFKKYGLDVELRSINESNENINSNNNSNNNDQGREEGHISPCNSNINNEKRAAKAAVSPDNENNTSTKNTNNASKVRVERIKKPILIRIKRRCHNCQTVFGAGDYCEECDHLKCAECPRSPLPETVTQKRGIAGAPGSGIAIGQEKRNTRIVAKDVNNNPVARVVTKWLDDMEPRVEGTSRMLKGCRQTQVHSELDANFSYSPSISTSDKKMKKMKKKKKKDQHRNNGGDNSKSNQPLLDIKGCSTSRTHGPTVVVASSPKPHYVTSSLPMASFKDESGPKVKQSQKAGATDDDGMFQSEVCHACQETVIPTLTSMCPKCQHICCQDCPRSSSFNVPEALEDTNGTAAAPAAAPATTSITNARTAIHQRQAQHWYQRQYQFSGQIPGEEYAQYLQNLILAQRQRQRQRVYKQPRVRVRWACNLCFSALDPKSNLCLGCDHERCKNCIRDPEKRKPRLPDPDVVQALEARLSSLMLNDPHVS